MQPTESNQIRPEPWAVRTVARETADTFTLSLQPTNGSMQRGFQPGQFSMLWIFGVGELPISISGDPSTQSELTYTVRSVGQATEALVTTEIGQQIGVRGPFGTGWPIDSARGKDVLIIAGGIGLAPLRPVIYRVLHQRDDYGRLIILYGARSPRDLLYRKELAAWARQKNCQLLSTVDYAGMNWRGHVGVVTKLLRYTRLQPMQTTAMMCGPEIMMRVIGRELIHRGVPAESIYLSMERNMKCAVGFCGHCQWGPHFICKDGPVFCYQQIAPLLNKYEL